MTSMIRSAETRDAAAIAQIYSYYILNSVATFEEQEVVATDMLGRMRDGETNNLPWLVAESDGRVVGYAYAGKWRGRPAYRFAAEVSVYLSEDSTGRGIGTRLYNALIAQLQARSYHVAIAGIALPNPASVALHEKSGMVKVAHFRDVGFKFGQWVDVAYWQRILDT